MTNERVFYSDSNGIRVGTIEMVFAKHRYGTRNVASASIETERRRRWPGIMMMVFGAAVLGFGLIVDAYQTSMMGAAAFAGGTFYFSRRKPTYGLRLNTAKGPVFVVASRNKWFLEQVKEAVDRSIDASRTAG
jgi:hypothetical protein